MTRSPLPINSNYYGMDQSYWAPTTHQTVRAATTIHHILNFKRLIDREELQPLVLRNTIPICMAQYQRLFNSTRYTIYDCIFILFFPFIFMLGYARWNTGICPL